MTRCKVALIDGHPGLEARAEIPDSHSGAGSRSLGASTRLGCKEVALQRWGGKLVAATDEPRLAAPRVEAQPTCRTLPCLDCFFGCILDDQTQ